MKPMREYEGMLQKAMFRGKWDEDAVDTMDVSDVIEQIIIEAYNEGMTDAANLTERFPVLKPADIIRSNYRTL